MTSHLSAWRAALAGAAEWLLPPACISCLRSLPPRFPASRQAPDHLCGECSDLLQPIDSARGCPRCGIVPFRTAPETTPGQCTACTNLANSFRAARSAYSYLSPAGNIVRNIKYRRMPFLAPLLVELSWAASADWLDEIQCEAVVPIPMHAFRQLARGFNQAEEIARPLAARLGVGLLGEEALLRRRHTSPQARYTSRTKRLENLEGCFLVKNPRPIHGKAILLVDDVMTTGATASSAASTLLEAGARQVFVFTPVRAAPGEDWEDAAESG